jgi:signal transduction histidine kinase
MRPESDADHRLAAIAHDLLNALAVVKGYSQLVQRQVRRGGEPAEAILRRLGRIDRQVDAATTLVDALRRQGRPNQDDAGSPPDGRDGWR